MAGNEPEIYKIFQMILNIILQILNLASSLKKNFLKSQCWVGTGI